MQQLLVGIPREFPQNAAEMLATAFLDLCQAPGGQGRESEIIATAGSWEHL